MSANEQISRLQGLLERVQMRAGAPRRSDAAANGGSPQVAESVHGARTAPPPAAAAEDEHDEVTQHHDEVTQHHHQEEVTQHAYAAAAEPSGSYDVDTDSEVEVSSETVEVDIDIDEPMAMESGAQPIANPTMPPEDLEEEAEEMPSATQPSHRPPAHEAHEAEELTQANIAQPPANEIEEPTPSSSRRPIAAEEPAAEAYEEESSPRHTPPPESGKQVAAPSVRPPSMKPSAPPPSLEGHTLIGGWREPGLGAPHISPGASTGVRVPAPPGMGTEPPATAHQPQMAQAQASGTRLTADVTRPELSAGGNVASFEGAAAVAKPVTLGELLDLTLGL